MEKYDVLIDDSMWGSAIGGVIVGLYSFRLNMFVYMVVGVEHFQSPKFENKTYMGAIAEASLEMVKELEIRKDEKILLCRGYCNNGTHKLLTQEGYDVTRGVIEEPLQSILEERSRKHLAEIGCELYYDPKDMDKKDIGRSFNNVVRWACIVTGKQIGRAHV